MNQTGARGELLVAEQLMARGWIVTTPLATAPYFDLLATKTGGSSLRIQVKTTLKKRSDGRPGRAEKYYQFQLARGLSSKKKYDKGEIDFFVCCCITDLKFWVIPFEAATVITLKIYSGNTGKFHHFADAWEQLDKY